MVAQFRRGVKASLRHGVTQCSLSLGWRAKTRPILRYARRHGDSV